jgi:hypothetical protein
MKSKILYTIGTFLGVLTLSVGLTIFTIWWGARHWFAFPLIDFEVYGFFWILISTPMAIIGLLFLLFTIGKNYPNFYWKTIVSLLVLLGNIPSLYMVLEKHSDIDRRVYFKLVNVSQSDIVSLKISASTFKKELENLPIGESTVSNFYPKYLSDPRRSVPLLDTVTVTISTANGVTKSIFPDLYKGSCAIIIIDENFQLVSKLPNSFNH